LRFINFLLYKIKEREEKMSCTPETYAKEKITVLPPKAGSKAGNNFCTMDVKYGGKKFSFFPTKPIFGNAIAENPKKAGDYSQGFSLETPELVNLAQTASDTILQAIVDNRDHDAMPKFVKKLDSVEKIYAAKDMGVTVKTIIHRPEARDEKGKPSGKPDPTATPKLYAGWIQCGPDHKETPNKIFTRYLSARVLNEDVDRAIKAGKDKEANYVFDPLGLFKSKSNMKCLPTIGVNDVYLADGQISIRLSLSEVYIVEFATQESVARKELRLAAAKSGEKYDGPTAMPTANVDEDEDQSNINVVDISSEGTFEVKITE
jgi:hypothetical protein